MSSFMLPDPYEGKTLPEMKKRCRQLIRALSRWEDIALTLAAKHGTDGLPDDDAAAVKNLLAAYED